jgi:hypothetical protein
MIAAEGSVRKGGKRRVGGGGGGGGAGSPAERRQKQVLASGGKKLLAMQAEYMDVQKIVAQQRGQQEQLVVNDYLGMLQAAQTVKQKRPRGFANFDLGFK